MVLSVIIMDGGKCNTSLSVKTVTRSNTLEMTVVQCAVGVVELRNNLCESE